MEEDLEEYLEEQEKKDKDQRVSIEEAFYLPSAWELKMKGVKVDD